MAAYRTCIRCNALKPEADYYIKKGYRMTVCKAYDKRGLKDVARAKRQSAQARAAENRLAV